MEKWKEYKATEFCQTVTDGTHDSPKPKDKGHYLITSKHLKDTGIDFNSANYISEEDYIKIIARSKVEQYDILFSMIGTIGNIVQVKAEYVDFAVKNMGIFKMGKNRLKSSWLLYWLKSPCAHEYVSQRLAGSTQSYLTLSSLREFPVLYPGDSKANKIVDILKSLDDKIELNRRINDNLEQQAQALFKSWFVDFEPFRDQPFVESELGAIPQSLIMEYISNIPHTLETGRRPKGGVGELTSGVPSVGAEHVKGMGNYDYSKTKFIPADYASSLKTGKVNGYELLIYKDGGKPGYFIPNYSIFGEGYPYDECYLNEHVFKLDFGDRGYNAFCYFFFKTDFEMNYLNAQGGKAAIPGINKQDIENILVYSPQNESVKDFGKLVLPMIKQILINCKESRRLAELRDTLLPRLMSGELKINEIENTI